MGLKDLGWNSYWEKQLDAEEAETSEPARVIEELKGFYRVATATGEFLAQVSGKVRFTAGAREGFPAVGDWVTVNIRHDEGRATIQGILPRKSKLSRKAAGEAIDEQILAANVETVFVVAALNWELNLRRIERYISLVWESGANAVVLLNKKDLCADFPEAVAAVEAVAPGVPVHALSAVTGLGLEALHPYLAPGMTSAFIGSSGVGKSTIINAVLGGAIQAVAPVREHDDRGQHTTTSRQLFLLDGGGLVIDTPGMRELQFWDGGDGLLHTFEDIEALAQTCKFRDCRHLAETGCAVQDAIDNGDLEPMRLANYRKLLSEVKFIEARKEPAVMLERKKKARRASKDQKHFYED